MLFESFVKTNTPTRCNAAVDELTFVNVAIDSHEGAKNGVPRDGVSVHAGRVVGTSGNVGSRQD